MIESILMSSAQVPLLGGTPVNLTMMVTLIYVVTYVLMDPMAGSLAAGMVLLLHNWTAGLVAANAPVQGYTLWQAVLAFHLVMWIAQVSTTIPQRTIIFALAIFLVHWSWCV